MSQIKNIVFNEIDESNYTKLEKFIQKNLQSYTNTKMFSESQLRSWTKRRKENTGSLGNASSCNHSVLLCAQASI